MYLRGCARFMVLCIPGITLCTILPLPPMAMKGSYILNSAFKFCSINHIIYIPCFMYYCFHVSQALEPPSYSAHDNWAWGSKQNMTKRFPQQNAFSTTKCSKAWCVSIRFGMQFLLLVLWVRGYLICEKFEIQPNMRIYEKNIQLVYNTFYIYSVMYNMHRGIIKDNLTITT